MTDAFKRITDFLPAWDRRDPNPCKNYGIKSVTLRMTLVGPKGATYFTVYTGWYLPSVIDPMSDERKGHVLQPCPCEVGYHSPTPQYEDQSVCREHCEFLDGRPCYADSSALAADEMFAVLVAEGGDAVWAKLEENYREYFGSEVIP